MNRQQRRQQEAAQAQTLSLQQLVAQGIALEKAERYADAEKMYRRLVAARPDLSEPYNSLGHVLERQNKLDEAIACYQQSTAIKKSALIYNNWGRALVTKNNPDEAIEKFRQAIAVDPHYVRAYLNLATLKTFTPDDPDFTALLALAEHINRFPDSEKLQLYFALYKIYDDVSDYARAFDHLLQGNALKRKEFNYFSEEKIEWKFQAIARNFNADFLNHLKDKGDPSPTPIFILGMLRSGSTLVEQILSSHPLVYGGGELKNMDHTIGTIRDEHGNPTPFPVYVPDMNPDWLKKLGHAYVNSLPPLPKGKIHITDKSLANFFHIGMIKLILPNAKIIHTMRDPLDTCFSCFSKLFGTGQEFTYDLGELGRFYRHYTALMNHWRSVLPPDSFLDVSYEAMVDDFENQAKRLVEFCGLPWDDRCLSFHKNDRPVQTASVLQVRQPLFRTSLKRGHKYEAHLKPLLDELSKIPA